MEINWVLGLNIDTQMVEYAVKRPGKQPFVVMQSDLSPLHKVDKFDLNVIEKNNTRKRCATDNAKIRRRNRQRKNRARKRHCLDKIFDIDLSDLDSVHNERSFSPLSFDTESMNGLKKKGNNDIFPANVNNTMPLSFNDKPRIRIKINKKL